MKKVIMLSIISTAILYGCGSKKSSVEESNESINVSEGTEKQETIVEKEAVCLLDELSVRKTPSDKGGWVTSISLGEVVMFTGLEELDSATKKTYYKIRLSGGKEGWSRGDFLEVDAKVGVFVKDTEIYSRPDLLTKTDRKYSQMDIIAIINTEDNWVEIKGKRKEGKYIESGWVKSGNISDNTINIATAKFGRKALEEKSQDKKMEALKGIIGNEDLASSEFIALLQKMVDEMTKPDDVEEPDVLDESISENDSIL